MAAKSTVTLYGVPLAGNSSVTWRLQTGTAPYTTVLSVHQDQWPILREAERNKKRRGDPLLLEITDGRGARTTIHHVHILHVVPSPSPKIVSFIVSDRRWKWSYKLVCRDYNIPKKTGDVTVLGEVPTQTTYETYRYRRSSLDEDGKRWTARAAVRDVMAMLDGSEGEGSLWKILSFPIDEQSEEGQLSIQNLSLRDQGDAALGRLLAMVPGLDVFIDTNGTAVLFDSADLAATERHRETLPPVTWDGEKSEMIDRVAIRPANVVLHYQREIEIAFEHHDDWDTQANPIRTEPYLENVIPTVDAETEVVEFDPESNQAVRKTVPAGTWVPIKEWLNAMDERRESDTFRWTFDTIASQWLIGDLDGVLGTKADSEERGNVSARVQAFRQHFRTTFRINRRYMERIRDIEAVRVAVLDPVTGARSPAAVWGQACVVPTTKGKRMIARRSLDGEASARIYENIDNVPDEGDELVLAPHSPARVSMIDRDLGIFSVDWLTNPYGTQASIVPCNVVGSSNELSVPIGDMALQDTMPMGPGMQINGGANAIFLARRQHMFVMLTVIPSAPNNEKQFHRVTVKVDDIAEKFVGEFRIQDGEGPDLHVFVPPGEATARFGWRYDEAATQSLVPLLGLNSDDPNDAGIEGPDIPGYLLVNGRFGIVNELQAHSQATAAEMLIPFADNVQGRVATIMRDGSNEGDRLKLVGNMSSATIHVASAPSGKVAVIHEFPGTQKSISRMALLPASVRRMLLGIVDPGIGN